jgi:hypothetical protein
MTPAVAPADKGGLAWCKGSAATSDLRAKIRRKSEIAGRMRSCQPPGHCLAQESAVTMYRTAPGGNAGSASCQPRTRFASAPTAAERPGCDSRPARAGASDWALACFARYSFGDAL